jgi:hypothetical protein
MLSRYFTILFLGNLLFNYSLLGQTINEPNGTIAYIRGDTEIRAFSP